MKGRAIAMALATSTLAATLASGCGGGQDGNVRYEGTTLFVDNHAYTRRSAADIGPPYEERAVYVGEYAGKRAELENRLDELGLAERIRYEAISHDVVAVPAGWEDQWSRALQAQPQVRSAWLNFIAGLASQQPESVASARQGCTQRLTPCGGVGQALGIGLRQRRPVDSASGPT